PVSLRYAERAKITLDGQAPASTPDASQPVWHQPRLIHAIFGAGRVTGEDESSFEVRFDNGDILNFSKKSAHLYFTPVTD
ncbi:MAG TPA: ATP-dependent helicase, partial [Marinobacter sp.]|nr:ATP-dependent helicase [Marinobacter sp.]